MTNEVALSPEVIQAAVQQVSEKFAGQPTGTDTLAEQMRRHINQQAQQSMSLSQTRMSMQEKVEWCKLMSAGDMVPKQYQGSPSNVLFALEYAEAVGVPAIHALTSIAVVNGKPSPMSDLMITLTRKAGHKTWTEVSEDGESATTYVIRNDMPERTFSETFDRKLAEKAGLWGKSGPWSQYPDVMLANRSKSRAVRMHCNEVLAGVDTSAEEAIDMLEGEVVDEPEQKPSETKKPKGIAAARSRSRKAKDAPAKKAEVDAPDNLSDGAQTILADAQAGDVDTRRALWHEAKNLDEHERLFVQAEIEAMMGGDNANA